MVKEIAYTDEVLLKAIKGIKEWTDTTYGYRVLHRIPNWMRCFQNTTLEFTLDRFTVTTRKVQWYSPEFKRSKPKRIIYKIRKAGSKAWEYVRTA